MQHQEPQKIITFWPSRKRLVFLYKEPNPGFWDQQWDNDDWLKTITRCRKNKSWRVLLGRYLPGTNSRILEGGCGDGRWVDAMKYWGYEAIGVDFATATVNQINTAAPGLDVRHGDVRKLNFEDNYFDGYLSLGVIEHFWEGYEAILLEMHRVLKPGGYAFVSFPAISPLDKFTILLNLFPLFWGTEKPAFFYQFGLDVAHVKNDFIQRGFEFITTRRQNGLLGIERFWPKFKILKDKLHGWSQKSALVKYLYFAASMLLAPLCGHSALMIFRKPPHPAASKTALLQ